MRNTWIKAQIFIELLVCQCPLPSFVLSIVFGIPDSSICLLVLWQWLVRIYFYYTYHLRKLKPMKKPPNLEIKLCKMNKLHVWCSPRSAHGCDVNDDMAHAHMTQWDEPWGPCPHLLRTAPCRVLPFATGSATDNQAQPGLCKPSKEMTGQSESW